MNKRIFGLSAFKLCLFTVCAVIAGFMYHAGHLHAETSMVSFLAFGACVDPFNVLRMRTEDLGPTLYTRASWMDVWMNVIQRGEYPVGAGLVRSVFTIGRSEPTTDEETWSPITTSSGSTYVGSCNTTYNQVDVGFLENTYKPEVFGLVGPLICQDDLTLNWESVDFWDNYFQAMEKRNKRSLSNRLGNIYMNYSTKVSPQSDGTIEVTAGNIATQPPGSAVDLSGVSLPDCELQQDVLDQDALSLMELGATNINSNGWINLGPSGPIFPLYIGPDMSNQLLLNNAELREDYRFAFESKQEIAPVIQRIGATRIIKNWRHVINLFPPRWGITDGTNAMYRVPTWVMSNSSSNATKGKVAVINPDWKNPRIACIEGAIALNPMVFIEEILRPVNSAPGQNWSPKNYYGDWKFVTGNDALLGFDDCTGVKDPVHKLGRHFAEFRHASKPLFRGEYGRLYLFRRCPQISQCNGCS